MRLLDVIEKLDCCSGEEATSGIPLCPTLVNALFAEVGTGP